MLSKTADVHEFSKKLKSKRNSRSDAVCPRNYTVEHSQPQEQLKSGARGVFVWGKWTVL